MKAATLSELQRELTEVSSKKMLAICIRLAKHKKENKELLTYLLYEAADEDNFIKSTQEETTRQFREMNKSTLYLAKKSIRKILRDINKYCRYSGKPATEIALRMHYLAELKASGIPFRESQVLVNLYTNQLKKIDATLLKLHEDLQYDYRKERAALDR